MVVVAVDSMESGESVEGQLLFCSRTPVRAQAPSRADEGPGEGEGEGEGEGGIAQLAQTLAAFNAPPRLRLPQSSGCQHCCCCCCCWRIHRA